MEGKIVYFEKPGPQNTEVALRIAGERARELGIKTVLVASTRGDVAVKAVEILKGFRVIGVAHAAGWKTPNTQEFTDENRKLFEARGGILLVSGHVFGGVCRAVRNQYNTYEVGDILAACLRLLGEGMKVVCEIATMAADSGLVRTDEDVICVAGTSKGADTAVVLTPVNSTQFFSLRVKEILCKPRF